MGSGYRGRMRQGRPGESDRDGPEIGREAGCSAASQQEAHEAAISRADQGGDKGRERRVQCASPLRRRKGGVLGVPGKAQARLHEISQISGDRMTMDRPINVCVLVGSLRKASLNGMLANALMSLAPSSMKLETVEIGQLPLFNQDLETAATPAPWTAFRQRVKAADAVLFVTPEYNRSVPDVLKNALDVCSRPYGRSVWDRKPGPIVSCSPSPIGAFGANHHLRQSLGFLNVPT